MTLFKAAYRMRLYKPRSQDATEAAVLVPSGGAIHADPFQIASITGVAGYQPYMDEVKGRRGQIDMGSRKTDTGELTVRLLDVRQTPGGSNLQRWFSAFLGDTQGRAQIAGLRAEIDESLDGGVTWTRFFTGRVSKAGLDTRVWVSISIREMNDELRFGIFVGQTSKNLGEATPTAPTVALAGAGAGNVDNGTHTYRVTFVTLMGESKGGTVSASVNVVNKTTNGQVSVTGIPLGSAACVARRLYRTVAGAGGEHLFVGEISNNTATTFTDNVADVDLNFMQPKVNRTQYAFRASVYPLGLPKPFGAIPAVRPVKATVVNITASLQLNVKITDTDLSRPDVALSQQLVDVLRRLSNLSDPNSPMPADYPDWLRIHVRNVTAGARNGAEGEFKTAAFLTSTRIPVGDLSLPVRVLSMDMVPSNDLEGIDVSNYQAGDTVELWCYLTGPASKENPIFVADVAVGQLVKDAMDGHFGYIYQPYETLPAGKTIGDVKRSYPYDATVAAIAADASIPKGRWIIDADVKFTDWTEPQICLASNLAYRLDNTGQLVLVDTRMPNAVPAVPTITNLDLADGPTPGWNIDREQAVTIVEAKRYMDRQLSTSEYRDLPWPINVPPGLVRSTDILDVVTDIGDLDVGEKKVTLDLTGYRSQPNESLNGVSRLEAIRLQARALMEQLRIPLSRGPVTVELDCLRTANTDAQPGEWRLLQIDELPDPSSLLRGGLRLARVVQRTEAGLHRQLTLVDAGVAVVANAPTIGTVVTETGNTKHGLAIPITLNAQGEPVVVEVASLAGGSPPAAASALWTFAGRVITTSTLTVRNLPAAGHWWVRARSVPVTGALQKLPSLYASAGPVDTTGFTAPSVPAVGSINDRGARFTWTNGETAYEVVIYLATPNTGTLFLVRVLPAASTQFDLTGLKASTSYRVEVGYRDQWGGLSARVGADFTTNTTILQAPKPAGIAIYRGLLV